MTVKAKLTTTTRAKRRKRAIPLDKRYRSREIGIGKLRVREEQVGLEKRRYLRVSGSGLTQEQREAAAEYSRSRWDSLAEGRTETFDAAAASAARASEWLALEVEQPLRRLAFAGLTLEESAMPENGWFEARVCLPLQARARRVLELLGDIEPAPEIGPPAPFVRNGLPGWDWGPAKRAQIQGLSGSVTRNDSGDSPGPRDEAPLENEAGGTGYPFGSALPRNCWSALELLEHVRYHLQLSLRFAEAGGADNWSRRHAVEGLAILAFQLGQKWSRTALEEEWEEAALYGRDDLERRSEICAAIQSTSCQRSCCCPQVRVRPRSKQPVEVWAALSQG